MSHTCDAPHGIYFMLIMGDDGSMWQGRTWGNGTASFVSVSSTAGKISAISMSGYQITITMAYNGGAIVIQF